MASAGTRASQDFVPVKEIRDGVIITNDGSLRMVLIASSINLALKSTEEQESVILQFQNFLNSLDFSVQIFIQSRRYDIRPYMATLEEREGVQLNDLLRIQTREYINFIKTLGANEHHVQDIFRGCPLYAALAWHNDKKGLFSFGGKSATTRGGKDALSDFDAPRTIGTARFRRPARACSLRRAHAVFGNAGSYRTLV